MRQNWAINAMRRHVAAQFARKFVGATAFSLCAARGAIAQVLPTLITTPQPRLSIGSENGAAALQFNGISDVMRLNDGRIVVANCGSNQIRFFDARGAFLSSVGQTGRGPGDFLSMRRLFAGGGDSIGVAEGFNPNFRITLLSSTGKVGRVVSAPVQMDVLGRLPDGNFVGRMNGRPSGTGAQRWPVTLYRLDANLKLTDSVTKVFGLEGPDGMHIMRMTRSAIAAVLPDRIVFGGQDDDSFTEFGTDLRLVRKVATFTKGEPITAELKRAWDAGKSVMFAEGGVGPVYSTEYAPTMPAYRDVETGTDGAVWLQDPYRPVIYPLAWTAYKDGKTVARAELPPRFAPTQFGANWVLGVAFDEFGVERVQLFDLKPGALSGRTLSPKVAQPPDVPRCGVWASR
ncbi:MAG: 6-bladed beta-propeller [Gemmatimonas sp.]